MVLARTKRARIGLLLSLAVAIALGGTASAMPIDTIGGTDALTSYTASSGILSFGATPGTVTTAPSAPFLIGADINFEGDLSTDPAGDVRDAVFVGTGSGTDITIVSGATVLLALELDYIEVVSAVPAGGGIIQMGSFAESQIGNPSAVSRLTVSGGSMNAFFGGVGTEAVLEILMSSLDPAMTKKLRNGGYLLSDFTNGLAGASTTWNLTLLHMPEPSTAVLLGCALLGLTAVARRSR